ncbi:hypothetical protein ACHQM5_030216 [Ranunculus cassubicifolius]
MIKLRARLLTFLFVLLSFMSHCWIWTSAHNSGTTVAKSFHVGLILDFETRVGKMCRNCIYMALEDFYAVHNEYGTRLVLHAKDSKDVVSAVFAAVDLLKEVDVIIGPQKSAQAEFVAELGNKYHVPVISFSATSPFVSRSEMPYFIRMTQNDTSQLEAIASIVVAFGWKDVILIYEESDYGNGIIPYLIDVFQTNNVRIPYKSVIPSPPNVDKILAELKILSAMQTRVFIVHLASPLGFTFFTKVKETGLMAGGNVWIITEELTSFLGSTDYDVIDSMRGVIGIKPYIPRSRGLEKFKMKMTRKLVQENETLDDLNIFCLHAYDTIWALAKSAEIIGTNPSFQETKRYKNLTDSREIGTSAMGPDLLKEILASKFVGLSGEILFLDGQLHPPVFQIINIVGQGEREIGFWIPMVGLSERPNGKAQSNLRPIIWPGESTVVPNGRVIPANGKKLRIGYPVKSSFSEFVHISRNGTSVTGFCIDVFMEVMKALPNTIPYEFVPFQKSNGERGGSYNDLVHQVVLQKYDAVVGDVTITANRSLSVDFSIPYTTGGVAMLVPLKYDTRTNLLIIFAPFSWNVWLIYVLVCIITVLVIWFFEHARISGVPFVEQIAQIPSTAWMLLRAFAFNQNKGVKVVSKFVVLIFVITNIVLFGLFMQVLAKIVCDNNGQIIDLEAKDLVKTGHFVGYQKDSFVLELVLKQLNFDQSQLKVYDSPEEYHEALQLGSQNGGVSAIFYEIPYIKVLMKTYGGKYTTVGQIYRMEGFGFGFPRGSPLAPDVSTAILSLVEDGKMGRIESKWLGSEGNFLHPPKNISSNSLSLNKIWGLFVTVVMVILSSFVVFMVAHLNRQSQHWFWRLLRCICQVDEDDQVAEPLKSKHDPGPDTLDVSNTTANGSGDESEASLDTETSEEETPAPSVEMTNAVDYVINVVRTSRI